MELVELAEGEWFGAICAPVGAWPWPASPISVLSVEPLKTGQGRLRLRFVAVFQPDGPRVTDATFQVLRRTHSHIVLQSLGDADQQPSLTLEPMSDEWLTQYWPDLLERTFVPAAYAADGPQDRLSLAYFSTASVIEHGVLPTSFPVDPHPMPIACKTLPFERQYDRLDSCLIRRGVLPKEMEDKWFAYVEQDVLVLRRSWTGYTIYTVELMRTGDGLETRRVTVNRDPEQYKCTDDAEDVGLLDRLIDHLILGKSYG